MQPHAAHAGVVKPLHLVVRRRRLEQRNAAIAILTGFEQVDQHAVIAAMRRRLHEDAALEAQEFVQPEQVFLGGVGRRERSVRRIGKRAVRPEHVEVRVA